VSDDHLRTAFARAAADPGDGRRSWEDVLQRSRRRRLAWTVRGLSRGVPAVAIPIALVALFAAVRPGAHQSVAGQVAGSPTAPAPGSVLYMRQVIRRARPLPHCTRVFQSWQSADGARRRYVDTIGSWSVDESAVHGPDGLAKLYLQDKDQVVVDRTTPRPLTRDMLADPVATLHLLLSNGSARITGHTRFAGRDALVIDVRSPRPPRLAKGDVERWIVDAATYRPLRVVEHVHLYDLRQVIRFTDYEWLPPGPASDALLDTQAAHPDASVRDTNLDEQNDGGFGSTFPEAPTQCGYPTAIPSW
jgi:hypothetical protein